MRVGNFLLGVKGHEGSGDDGYVRMKHGEQYELSLQSRSSARADVRIMIDGEDMGSYRLDDFAKLVLERSATDRGKFTFYKSGTDDAAKAGLADVSADKLGLIQAVFRPERYRDREEKTSGGIVLPLDSMDSSPRTKGTIECSDKSSRGVTRGGISGQSMGFASGGTGLSGHSNQDFTTVQNLDYDPGKEVTISLRLVCDDSPRPKVPVEPVRANPVPEPVAS